MSTVQDSTVISKGDKQRLFAALDLLQDQRAEAEQRNTSLMDAKAAEEDMYNRLRDMQIARGLPVDEEELRAAVRATREPTGISYEAPQEGVARTLASLYIKRARWLPAATLVFALSFASWGAIEATQYVRARNFEEAVVSAQQSQTRLASEFKQAETTLSNWPNGEGQEAHKSGFASSLGIARGNLAQAWEALRSPTPATLGSAATLLASAEKALSDAQVFQGKSREQAELVRTGAQWLVLVPEAGWPEAAQRIESRKVQLKQALASGDLNAARNEINALSALSTALATRATLREAVGLVPVNGQGEAIALRSRGEAALLSGDMNGANEALRDIRALTDAIARSYTLKIVNENGVDTGFWRRPNNNPSEAYNYYVVVDALDATGNPVSLPVVNEENGERHTVSRFAVRVSQAVFESVKADKIDNGLIDNPIVGTKRAGEIKPEYNMDAGAGIITHW